MIYKKFPLLGMIMILLLPVSVRADVNDHLDQWWNSVSNFGEDMDFNPAGIYQGQTAMYATAGGMDWRHRSRDFSLGIDVQAPRITAGCGGIDMYLGGISAVNAGEFIQSLEAIARDGTSLMFLLALQVVSPMLGDVVEDIRKFAQDYLNLNFNSCDVAKSIIGGTHAKLSSEQQNCITERMASRNEDYTDASYACSMGAARSLMQNKNDFTNGNMFWYAVMQNQSGVFAQDAEFSQLIMNLVGTFIYTSPRIEDTDPPEYDMAAGKALRVIDAAINNKGPTATGKTILSLILYGSDRVQNDQELKFCVNPNVSTDGCTELVSRRISTLNVEGLEDRIERQVAGIVQKIFVDEPLTESEQWLVASSRIPLYKYLTVAAAAIPFSTGADRTPSQLTMDMVDEYGEYLAKDIAINGLIDAVEQVRSSLGNLPFGVSYSEGVNAYRQSLNEVLTGLSVLDRQYAMSAQQYFDFYDQMHQFEKLVISTMAHTVTASAMWGG